MIGKVLFDVGWRRVFRRCMSGAACSLGSENLLVDLWDVRGCVISERSIVGRALDDKYGCESEGDEGRDSGETEG